MLPLKSIDSIRIGSAIKLSFATMAMLAGSSTSGETDNGAPHISNWPGIIIPSYESIRDFASESIARMFSSKAKLPMVSQIIRSAFLGRSISKDRPGIKVIESDTLAFKAFFLATSSAFSSHSIAKTLEAPAFAAAIARIPVPVPISITVMPGLTVRSMAVTSGFVRSSSLTIYA